MMSLAVLAVTRADIILQQRWSSGVVMERSGPIGARRTAWGATVNSLTPPLFGAQHFAL
jgi:hypothetical protein